MAKKQSREDIAAEIKDMLSTGGATDGDKNGDVQEIQEDAGVDEGEESTEAAEGAEESDDSDGDLGDADADGADYGLEEDRADDDRIDDEDEEEFEEDEEDLDEDADAEEEEEEEEEGAASEDEEDPAVLKAQVAALQAQLDKGLRTPAERVETPEPEPAVLQATDFVSEDEFDAALQDRTVLNTLLMKVATYAHDQALSAAMQRVPQLVSQEVTRENAHQQLVQDFYRENADLKPVQAYVGFVFEQTLAKNPGMTFSEALTATANAVRTNLKMVKKGAQDRARKRRQRSRRGGPAGLPEGSRGRRRAPTAPSGIADEIAELSRIR